MDKNKSAYERTAPEKSASLRSNPLRLVSLAYTKSRASFPVTKTLLFGTHVVPSGGLSGHPILESLFPKQPVSGTRIRSRDIVNALVFIGSRIWEIGISPLNATRVIGVSSRQIVNLANYRHLRQRLPILLVLVCSIVLRAFCYW